MKDKIWLALGLVIAIAIPCIALAQDAAIEPASGGIPIAAIVAGLTAAAAALGALLDFLPAGWRTYANIIAAALATVIPTLTDLSHSGQAITLGAVITALIGAAIGRHKAGKG